MIPQLNAAFNADNNVSNIRGSKPEFKLFLGWHQRSVLYHQQLSKLWLLQHQIHVRWKLWISPITQIAADGRTTTVKQIGTIHPVLKDDTGKNWSYDIPDIVYDPKSPYSLLGIPFLDKYFAKNNEAKDFDNDTDLHQPASFSNGTMANINNIFPMKKVIYQNY